MNPYPSENLILNTSPICLLFLVLCFCQPGQDLHCFFQGLLQQRVTLVLGLILGRLNYKNTQFGSRHSSSTPQISCISLQLLAVKLVCLEFRHVGAAFNLKHNWIKPHRSRWQQRGRKWLTVGRRRKLVRKLFPIYLTVYSPYLPGHSGNPY